MWFDNIPGNTTVVSEECEPKFFKGSKTSILLIHGYTGSPHDMLYLGKRLHNAGFSVYTPRLPGHGTNSVDFLNSNYKQWLRTVTDAYIYLQKKSEETYICGLSMGGLLTILLAGLFNPKRIALASPAIDNYNKKIWLTPVLKWFTRKIKKSSEQTFDVEYLNTLARQYWNYDWPSKAADLLKLQLMARKRLERVGSDCLTIVSKGDKTVPWSVADQIEGGIRSKKKKRLVLEESPHVVVNDIEKEKVADAIIDWFS